jgi:hypothetical protein
MSQSADDRMLRGLWGLSGGSEVSWLHDSVETGHLTAVPSLKPISRVNLLPLDQKEAKSIRETDKERWSAEGKTI